MASQQEPSSCDILSHMLYSLTLTLSYWLSLQMPCSVFIYLNMSLKVPACTFQHTQPYCFYNFCFHWYCNVVYISFFFLVSISSLGKFKVVDLKSMSSQSNIWAPSGQFLSIFFSMNRSHFPVFVYVCNFFLKIGHLNMMW